MRSPASDLPHDFCRVNAGHVVGPVAARRLLAAANVQACGE
jgi:hypothetical protein